MRTSNMVAHLRPKLQKETLARKKGTKKDSKKKLMYRTIAAHTHQGRAAKCTVGTPAVAAPLEVAQVGTAVAGTAAAERRLSHSG